MIPSSLGIDFFVFATKSLKNHGKFGMTVNVIWKILF